MGTVFVVHLSHLDDAMILKLLLLCSLFLLTASQEDDDAGKETAEDVSASQTNSLVVGSKRGNQGIGRSAKGLRWNSWSSWCYYNGCPADRKGTVHPQCCRIRITVSPREPIVKFNATKSTKSTTITEEWFGKCGSGVLQLKHG